LCDLFSTRRVEISTVLKTAAFLDIMTCRRAALYQILDETGYLHILDRWKQQISLKYQ